MQLIGAVRPGPGDTTGRTAFTRRAIICSSGETTELVTVLKVSGCLGAGPVDDDGQLNQPLPGPGPGGALADGARWTSAGRALKLRAAASREWQVFLVLRVTGWYR